MMIRRRLACSLLLLAAGLAGCRARTPNPLESPSVLATIDGRPILRDEFDAFSRTNLGSATETATPEVFSALFDQYVEEEVLANRASPAGSPHPAGPAERRAAVEAFLRKAVESAPPVDDADIAKYCEAHPERLALPERVKLRQILVRTQEEAKDIRARLAAGDTFEAVSRKFSIAPNADRGGPIGTITRGQLPPEFEAVIFRLRVGEVSAPVPAPSGYHFFLIESHELARTVPLAEVRGAIRQELEREREEERARGAAVAAVSAARVELAPDHFPFRYRGRWNGAPVAATGRDQSIGSVPVNSTANSGKQP